MPEGVGKGPRSERNPSPSPSIQSCPVQEIPRLPHKLSPPGWYFALRNHASALSLTLNGTMLRLVWVAQERG